MSLVSEFGLLFHLSAPLSPGLQGRWMPFLEEPSRLGPGTHRSPWETSGLDASEAVAWQAQALRPAVRTESCRGHVCSDHRAVLTKPRGLGSPSRSASTPSTRGHR